MARAVAGILTIGAIGVAAWFMPQQPVRTGAVIAPVSDSADHKGRSPENNADFSGALAAYLLRASLRDPDSLVIEDIYSRVPATAVCMRYRAKNGFGGYVREQIVLFNLSLTRNAAVWNKQCAGSGFRQISSWNMGIYEQAIRERLSR